jgi:hypothetical protein
MSDLVTNHVELGLNMLLEQFRDSTNLRGVLEALFDQIQDLEDAVQPIIDARNIDDATADRLDCIGQLVQVPRDGRSDDAYRIRIRAELALLNSDGTTEDLIAVLQALLALATPDDILVNEYFPKTIYIRPQNLVVSAADAAIINTAMNRAKPAGTELHLVYTDTASSDETLFRFSDVADTTETNVTHGFDAGVLAGDMGD